MVIIRPQKGVISQVSKDLIPSVEEILIIIEMSILPEKPQLKQQKHNQLAQLL
tara:strand:- start:244 stop:402 length:159 start_codon:yes stop_codon:yes gene_type:complete